MGRQLIQKYDQVASEGCDFALEMFRDIREGRKPNKAHEQAAKIGVDHGGLGAKRQLADARALEASVTAAKHFGLSAEAVSVPFEQLTGRELAIPEQPVKQVEASEA